MNWVDFKILVLRSWIGSLGFVDGDGFKSRLVVNSLLVCLLCWGFVWLIESNEGRFEFLGLNVAWFILGVFGFTFERDIGNKSGNIINSIVDNLTATIGKIDVVRTTDWLAIAYLLAAVAVVVVINSIGELVRSNRFGFILYAKNEIFSLMFFFHFKTVK